MSVTRTLGDVLAALKASGISYMLTGSTAGSFHGLPRSTQDIDIVVEGTEDQLVSFADQLRQRDFYVSDEAAREAVRHHGQFNAIDRRTAWKIDLIVRKDREFSRVEFARRRRAETLGFSLWIATAEDTVLAKLEWVKQTASERQMDDVIGILRTRRGELDFEYLEKWVPPLRLEEEWRTALKKSDEP